jgi:hypothetical protein
MLKHGIALSILISGLISGPCFAQSMQYDPSSSTPFQETTTDPSSATSSTVNGMNDITAQQNYITGITYYGNEAQNVATRNGLPATSMDSFVYEAGGFAELIYGDEGTSDIPPYFGFDESHRINLGIMGTRAAGLTTGHGSLLPNAWGGDEFDMPEPWTQAGSSMPTAPGTLNLFGLGSISVPNLNVPGVPNGLQSLVGGTTGLVGGTTNSLVGGSNPVIPGTGFLP